MPRAAAARRLARHPIAGLPNSFLSTGLMRNPQISPPAECTHPESCPSSDFDDFKRHNGTWLAQSGGLKVAKDDWGRMGLSGRDGRLRQMPGTATTARDLVWEKST
jgi:hypothetical protein